MFMCAIYICTLFFLKSHWVISRGLCHGLVCFVDFKIRGCKAKETKHYMWIKFKSKILVKFEYAQGKGIVEVVKTLMQSQEEVRQSQVWYQGPIPHLKAKALTFEAWVNDVHSRENWQGAICFELPLVGATNCHAHTHAHVHLTRKGSHHLHVSLMLWSILFVERGRQLLLLYT